MWKCRLELLGMFRGMFTFLGLPAPLASRGVVCRLGVFSTGRDDDGEASEVGPVFVSNNGGEVLSLIMLLHLGSKVLLASWRCSRPHCLPPLSSLLFRQGFLLPIRHRVCTFGMLPVSRPLGSLLRGQPSWHPGGFLDPQVGSQWGL